MSKPIQITKPALLIGEGRDEEKFFTAFVDALGLSACVQVTEYGGKNALKGFLSALAAIPPLKALGITRDADSDYSAALKSVNTAIQAVNLPDSVEVKSFILPKENTSGALEALVLEAAATTSAWPCVERFMECVAPKDAAPLSPTEKDKRQIHVWLSTLSNPELRLGEAALKGLIPFDHQAFQSLADFIKSLASATEDGSPHA